MNVVDLTDGRWVPLDEQKTLNTAAEPTGVIDMAEERVVETPEDEVSEAVRELVAEALAYEDDSQRPAAELSQPSATRELDWSDPRWLDRDRWIELAQEGTLADYFMQEPQQQAKRQALVEAWGEAEDGKPRSKRTVDLAAQRRGNRQALLDAWERVSG